MISRVVFLESQAALAHRIPNPTVVICPGFVDTDMAPPFFKYALPFMVAVR